MQWVILDTLTEVIMRFWYSDGAFGLRGSAHPELICKTVFSHQFNISELISDDNSYKSDFTNSLLYVPLRTDFKGNLHLL